MLLFTQTSAIKPDGSLVHELSELFDKFGVIQVVLLFTLGLGLFLAYRLGYAWFTSRFSENTKQKDEKIDELTKMLAKMSKKERSNNATTQYIDSNTIVNLRQHPFFDNLDIWMEIRLGQMYIEPESKYNIFKDFLYIKLSVMKNRWLKFIENNDFANMSRDELKSNLMALLITINNETLDKIESAGFPDKVLKKLNKSSVLVDRLISTAIEGFTTNDHFEDCYDAMYAILQVNMSILEVVVYDLAGIMTKLNGSLDDVVYEVKFYKK